MYPRDLRTAAEARSAIPPDRTDASPKIVDSPWAIPTVRSGARQANRAACQRLRGNRHRLGLPPCWIGLGREGAMRQGRRPLTLLLALVGGAAWAGPPPAVQQYPPPTPGWDTAAAYPGNSNYYLPSYPIAFVRASVVE